MVKNIRDLLALLAIPMILVWFAFGAIVVHFFDLSTLEAIGYGTATGIFLTAFANMWQFYFRKAGNGEKKPPE